MKSKCCNVLLIPEDEDISRGEMVCASCLKIYEADTIEEHTIGLGELINALQDVIDSADPKVMADAYMQRFIKRLD